jgi:D-amino-acid dehydrogenase
MKVAVLGGGVIGVTTAYYLQQRGHEVVVYDRRGAVGLETSFANAGQISWGYAGPWAAPSVPTEAVTWLFARHAPVVLRPRLDPALWCWVWSFLRNCTARRYAINKLQIVRLAQFSHDSLVALRRETGIRYGDVRLGTLQLFRDAITLDKAQADAEVLRGLGVPHKMMDRDECLAVEPALASVAEKIVGGLHLPGDETGDCHQFTKQLACLLSNGAGVQFRMVTNVERLEVGRDGVDRVIVNGRPEYADAYVLALGSHSSPLLRSIGIHVPVYPVKSYCATLPISDERAAPHATVMDEQYRIAITRMDGRIRAVGLAEFDGYDLSAKPAQCRTVRHVLENLFPHAGRLDEISYETGLCAMTPTGLPLVERTRHDNLFVNTGHGAFGWTMACATGQIVANLVSLRARSESRAPLSLTEAAAGASS